MIKDVLVNVPLKLPVARIKSCARKALAAATASKSLNTHAIAFSTVLTKLNKDGPGSGI